MQNEIFKRIISSAILLPAVIFFIFYGGIFFYLLILVCFALSVYEWSKLVNKKFYFYLGLFFLIFSFFSFYELRNSFDNNYFYIFLIISICVSTDIGGYVFGKLIKGPKLTSISPNKTISGLVGSYILSFSLIPILIKINIVDIDKIISMVIFVFTISSLSQIGDITISYFKRVAKVKDTGKIIPGHGGLLDRIDGMLFAFPTAYMIISNSTFNIIQ
tara:strand:+ start:225 stop:875 length:651 start_codon:yes stop_codon:yes gene_type:complete